MADMLPGCPPGDQDYVSVSGYSRRLGCRQSMSSSCMASWGGVKNTLPSRADGQAKRPRSSLLVNRQRPSPVDQSSLTWQPERQRKIKR